MPSLNEESLTAEELFRTWAPFVARMLGRVGVPPADLEDAVQEVFLVAHRRGGFTPGRACEKTWLAEIALRVASNVRRTRRRRPTVHDETALGQVSAQGADPLDCAELRQKLERVAAALESLSQEARLVFVMVEIEQASAEEVARAQGVPVGTVYSRLHTARKQFRAAYEANLAAPASKPSLLSIVRERLSLSRPLLAKKELAQ